MVVVFGAGMDEHFSPKDLGLSVGVSGTVFRQFGLDYLGNSKMNCRVLFVLLPKLNNMMVVCVNYVNTCMLDILT